MLLTTHEPLEVVKSGLYDDANEQYGRFVDVTNGDGSNFRYTLGRELVDRGETPSVGDSVYLTLEAYRRPSAREGRPGERPWVKWETKYRVVGFKSAAAAKAA